MNDVIERFSRIVAEAPDDELAQFSLGKAYHDVGRFAEAKRHLELAIARQPDWMTAQVLLGRCELALGNRAAAQSVLEQAHRLAKQQNHQGPLGEIQQLLAVLPPGGEKL